MKLTQHI